MNRQIITLALTVASMAAFAQTINPAPSNLVDGEVRKIDKDAKKITIRHGKIESLNMPGMTMVFQVTDPVDLDKIKPGDKVQFKADRSSGGAFLASEITPAGK